MSVSMVMPRLEPILIPTAKYRGLKRYWVWLTQRTKWRLVEDWFFEFAGEIYFIPAKSDFVFDGASIPRIFQWLLRPTGILLIAGILHDYGYKYRGLKKVVKNGDVASAHLTTYSKEELDVFFRKVAIKTNGFVVINYVAWLMLFCFGRFAWDKHRNSVY